MIDKRIVEAVSHEPRHRVLKPLGDRRNLGDIS